MCLHVCFALRSCEDVSDVAVDNFMDRLDNGVVVCKLARLIEQECHLVGRYGLHNGLRPAVAEVTTTNNINAKNGSLNLNVSKLLPVPFA